MDMNTIAFHNAENNFTLTPDIELYSTIPQSDFEMGSLDFDTKTSGSAVTRKFRRKPFHGISYLILNYCIRFK